MITIYYRHSFDVAGYVWFADIYCAECGDSLSDIDPEGNEKSPIFVDGLWEFKAEGEHTYNCATCGLETEGW